MEQEKFCNECGTPKVNGYCPKCNPEMFRTGAPVGRTGAPAGQPGAPIGQAGIPAGGAYQGNAAAGTATAQYAQGGYQQPYTQQPVQGGGKGEFGTPDEELIMKIGSGYAENFMSGAGLVNNAALLTNKRVYYSGKCYASFGIGVKRCKAVQSVDLKDITGTGIYSVFNVAMLVIGIVLALASLVMFIVFPLSYGLYFKLPPMVIGILFIAISLLTARTMLRIDYAGGYIALNMRKFSRAECTAFQKAVLAAKDNITSYR